MAEWRKGEIVKLGIRGTGKPKSIEEVAIRVSRSRKYFKPKGLHTVIYRGNLKDKTHSCTNGIKGYEVLQA